MKLTYEEIIEIIDLELNADYWKNLHFSETEKKRLILVIDEIKKNIYQKTHDI